MANTYTQLHVHCVFAVQNRDAVIRKVWRDELYKYMTGIIRNLHHKLIIIHGMPDHVHILVGMNPTQCVADFLQILKKNSSQWINERKLSAGRFSWQEGYGAFACSKDRLPSIIKYIENQEQHHKKTTFTDEYKEFLKSLDIEFSDNFIFKEVIYDEEEN